MMNNLTILFIYCQRFDNEEPFSLTLRSPKPRRYTSALLMYASAPHSAVSTRHPPAASFPLTALSCLVLPSPAFALIPLYAKVTRTHVATSQVINTVVFRGLRLKTGVDTGQVLGEVHAMTGRMTYRGKVMNRAARIASTASTGQVLCSSDSWQLAMSADSQVRPPRRREGSGRVSRGVVAHVGARHAVAVGGTKSADDITLGFSLYLCCCRSLSPLLYPSPPAPTPMTRLLCQCAWLQFRFS